MRARHATIRPDMQWLEMDIRDLKFQEGDFDVVLDKGTMDAMLTSKGDVWVSCRVLILERVVWMEWLMRWMP